MAYGPDMDAMFDRAAGLADRILKGANPAELPLELPTRLKLSINLKTAQALGLEFPESIVLRADDVNTRRRLQHLQRPTPSRLSPHAPRASRRGDDHVADRSRVGLTIPEAPTLCARGTAT